MKKNVLISLITSMVVVFSLNAADEPSGVEERKETDMPVLLFPNRRLRRVTTGSSSDSVEIEVDVCLSDAADDSGNETSYPLVEAVVKHIKDYPGQPTRLVGDFPQTEGKFKLYKDEDSHAWLCFTPDAGGKEWYVVAACPVGRLRLKKESPKGEPSPVDERFIHYIHYDFRREIFSFCIGIDKLPVPHVSACRK